MEIPDSKDEYYDFYCMLVETHSDQMFNIALHILRNTCDAQDAIQDSFQSLWLHMQSTTFTPEKYTPQYMHKIVKNASLKLIEKRQKHETSEFTDCMAYEITSYISTPDEYSRHELYHALLSDIRQMNPIYRDVLFLHYVKDMPPRQIAKALKRPTATVKSQLQRGKKILQNKWG